MIGNRWFAAMGPGAFALALVLLGLGPHLTVQAEGQTAAQEASTASPEDWPEPPGEIRFVGKNKIARANSEFHRWRIARADFNPEQLQGGEIVIEVDVASLDTGIEKRDDHLRQEEFFWVEQHPVATVRVYDAQPAGPDLYKAKMDLIIRGVTKTKEVEFEVTERDPLTVRGELTLDREEFGVGKPHNKLNPLSVEPEVPVSFLARLGQVSAVTE